MKKNIFIFLNNELTSLDTIIPFLIELKAVNPQLNINFFAFNKKTMNTIESNFFLYGITNELGNLSRFGSASLDSYPILRRLVVVLSLIKLIMQGLFQKNVYIHFKGLEAFPFNLLYFTNKKNCYLFEANPWGHANALSRAYNINADRPLDYEYHPIMRACSTLVSYSNNWPQLKSAKLAGKNIYYIEPPRSRKEWLDYCKRKSQEYLASQTWLQEIIKTKKMILYLFGTTGPIVTLDNSTNGRELFLKTLEHLKKIENAFIIIKPHPNADLKELAELIKQAEMDNIEISLMHPSVLANYCSFSISNYFSFTLADAWFAGSRTIEYTFYKQALLRATNNQSTYPAYVDSFLQSDEADDLIKTLNSNGKVYERDFYADIPRNDLTKLLDVIAN